MCVSIIVPAYNAEHSLQKCIETLIAQSYPHIEIIIVDDGSNDKTKKIARELERRDARILYIYQDNKGVSVARNSGIAISHGTYIAFCDSDDFVSKNYIESMMASMRESRSDWVVSGFTKKFGSKEYIYDNPFHQQIVCSDLALFADEWYKNPYIAGVCGALYISDIIKKNDIKFPEGLQHGEDTIFNIQYYSCCKKVSFVNAAIYTYIEQEGSLTKTYQENIWQNQETIFKYFADMCKKVAYDKAIVDKFFMRGVTLSFNHAATHAWSKNDWNKLCAIISSSNVFQNLSISCSDLDKFAGAVLFLMKQRCNALLYYIFHVKIFLSVHMKTFYYLFRR